MISFLIKYEKVINHIITYVNRLLYRCNKVSSLILYLTLHYPHIMKKAKPKKIKYQCIWDGRLFNSEEEALNKSFGPMQPFQEGHDKYPPKGFFGTIAWRKGDRNVHK